MTAGAIYLVSSLAGSPGPKINHPDMGGSLQFLNHVPPSLERSSRPGNLSVFIWRKSSRCLSFGVFLLYRSLIKNIRNSSWSSAFGISFGHCLQVALTSFPASWARTLVFPCTKGRSRPATWAWPWRRGTRKVMAPNAFSFWD